MDFSQSSFPITDFEVVFADCMMASNFLEMCPNSNIKFRYFFLLGLNVHEEETNQSISLANSVSIPSITGEIDIDYNTQEDNRPKKRRSVRNCFV